jgi:hypothetical protein
MAVESASGVTAAARPVTVSTSPLTATAGQAVAEAVALLGELLRLCEEAEGALSRSDEPAVLSALERRYEAIESNPDVVQQALRSLGGPEVAGGSDVRNLASAIDVAVARLQAADHRLMAILRCRAEGVRRELEDDARDDVVRDAYREHPPLRRLDLAG